MSRKRKYFGDEEGADELPAAPADDSIEAGAVIPEVATETGIRESWPERWREFASTIREAGATCDLKTALECSGVEFLTWFAEAFPVGAGAGSFWVKFVDEVERDLALESIEPDGDAASFGEFLEAVARQIDMVVCKQPSIWALKSPNETVTGIREATKVPHVLSVWALLLRRYAQWMGEGVGRAGEQIPSPVHDPNWVPGNYPWSLPKSRRR